MPHIIAKNLVIHCIDCRLQGAMKDWMQQEGLFMDTDQLSIAGSLRDLVKPIESAHRDALVRQIELSIKLQDPRTIIIIDHQDCGAYAQDNTIASGLSESEDRRQHEEWAQKGREELAKLFPGKEVLFYYCTLAGQVSKL